jgi:ureidoglycolate lyase
MQPTTPAAARHLLHVTTLTAERFAPFGEVIQVTPDAPHRVINAGFAQRFDGLATIDTSHAGGHARFSIFRTLPRQLPLKLSLVERHQLGSQLFMPLAGQRFLVVVAAAGVPPSVHDLHGFVVPAGQGVNLARGTWHHPLLALDGGGDFLVIERGGAGADTDCEEHDLRAANIWVDAA